MTGDRLRELLGEFGAILRNPVFLGILAAKFVLLGFFSSDYQDRLFLPFLTHFVQNGGDPWDYFYRSDWPANMPSPFPYPPLMLLLLAPFYALNAALPDFAGKFFVTNVILKIPTLAADMLIVIILWRWYRDRVRDILWFYFASPIVLFSCYMHSQLDLIPTAILLLSVFFLLRGQALIAGLAFGCALATKSHVLAALPIMAFFAFRNYTIRKTLLFAALPPLLLGLFSAPMLFSEGYRHLVLANEQQSKLLNVSLDFGQVQLLLPVFAVLFIYARFLAFNQINKHLLHSSLGALFSVFVMLVAPATAWYAWLVPFLTIFFLSNRNNVRLSGRIVTLYAILSLAYLGYFLCFHIAEISDLSFAGVAVDLKIRNAQLRNIAFTTLSAILFAIIYLQYRYGIQRNSLYIRNQPTAIGISGDSSSGKTTLLGDLRNLFGADKLLELEGDGEHKWERGDKNWQQFTHIHPKANFLYKQSDNLLKLKRGEIIERVEYDHDSGKFTNPIQVHPRPIIVLSGLHSFYLPRLRNYLDLKIFMDTAEDLRVSWKIDRDSAHRGYTPEAVKQQIASRLEDARKFILPQKEHADLIISYGPRENEDGSTTLAVKTVFGVNHDVETLVEGMEAAGFRIIHDYMDDPKYQFLYLEDTEVPGAVFARLARRVIEDMEYLIDPDEAEWHEGGRGFVQLMILYMLSNIWKEPPAHV